MEHRCFQSLKSFCDRCMNWSREFTTARVGQVALETRPSKWLVSTTLSLTRSREQGYLQGRELALDLTRTTHADFENHITYPFTHILISVSRKIVSKGFRITKWSNATYIPVVPNTKRATLTSTPRRALTAEMAGLKTIIALSFVRIGSLPEAIPNDL